MKYPLIIVCICTLALVFLNAFKGEKIKADTVFKPIQHPAPADLLEYPPAGGEDHGEGLYSIVISPPKNNLPLRAYDIVHLDYKVWNQRGENIDSSDRNHSRIKLRVDGGGSSSAVIEGWKKILPYLRDGETRRVWIPKALAYKNTTNPSLSGRLVFDITATKVERALPIPEFDSYPTEPSKEATTHSSGLISQKTKSTTAPSISQKEMDLVEIHLNLWDKDGNLISSTEKKNRQLQLSPQHSIPAIQECINLMQVGERYRFWIPAELAYGDNPPASFPKGDFIADIELLRISQQIEDVTSHLMRSNK